MIIIIGNVIEWLLFVFLLLLAAAIIVVLIKRTVNSNRYRVSTKNGIEESFYLELGRIEQFVQIRGEDVSNPVVIFLHGGPGFPIGYLSYYYQADLISDYTFISWDQRGCGRTYYKNKDEVPQPSAEQLLSDLDELVNCTMSRFNKEKVIIIGQSWGSVLGMRYTVSHPGKVSAYISVGQAVDFDYGKIFAAKKAISTAKKLGNNKDVEILEKAANVFSYSNSVSETDINNLETLTKTSFKYLASGKQISLARQGYIGITSPDMNLNDLRWFFNAINTKKIFALEEPLVDYSYFEFDVSDMSSSFDVPMYFIQGEDDWITPTPMVQEYFETVNAPDKELIIMQGCGHTPFLDDPTGFAYSIKTVLNRIKE